MIFTPKSLDQTQSIGIPFNWASRLIKTHRHWWRTEGAGVKIAILDSGINLEHPAFAGAIVDYKNFTGGEENNVTDETGHGTHCAGIIAARAIAPDGMCGIAPQSELYIAKVISEGEGNWDNASQAIKWVLNLNQKIKEKNLAKKENWDSLSDGDSKKAKPIVLESEISIINMSFSGSNPTSEFYELIHDALASGICIITAAGNEGARLGNGIGFPGKYGSVITVGSHGEFGNPSSFSSRGGEIDFLAPGYDVWSTDIKRLNSTDNFHNWYQKRSGTSMAAPFVSGLAALIKSKHLSNKSSLTPAENCQDLYKHLIRMSAHPGYFDQESGYGPLLTFGNWDKIVNPQGVDQNSGFDESFIYYRQDEPISARDDRVDILRLRGDEYWRELIENGSGGPWGYEDIPFLKSHISKQARQVGFLINEEVLKTNGITIDKKKKKWVIHTKSLEKFVGVEYGNPMSRSARYFDQSILFGRTVFHAADGKYFYTAHHDLDPLTKNKQPIRAFDEAVKFNVKGCFIIFGYEVGLNNQIGAHSEEIDTGSIIIETKNIFKCCKAVGSDDLRATRQDWLIIKTTKDLNNNQKRNELVTEKDQLERERDTYFTKKLRYKTEASERKVYSIGFGYGLPQKFIPDGTQFKFGSRFFRECSLDSFKGNSGSPVFSCDTFEIIGIHSKGENNHVFIPKQGENGQEMIWNSGEELSRDIRKSVYQKIERVKEVFEKFRN